MLTWFSVGSLNFTSWFETKFLCIFASALFPNFKAQTKFNLEMSWNSKEQAGTGTSLVTVTTLNFHYFQFLPKLSVSVDTGPHRSLGGLTNDKWRHERFQVTFSTHFSPIWFKENASEQSLNIDIVTTRRSTFEICIIVLTTVTLTNSIKKNYISCWLNK